MFVEGCRYQEGAGGIKENPEAFPFAIKGITSGFHSMPYLLLAVAPLNSI